MGVMLNPYGNRLGISNFWQGTFNVYYSENLNFKFYELLSIVKFTIDLFILNLFENTKKSKDASFLLLFVSLNLNILKFKNKRLDVFLKLFDYRMFVMFVENNYKTRHFMLLRFLRMFFRLFTFRLKKIQVVKNIIDWKLLVFYEHMYTKIISKDFKNNVILKKKNICINKSLNTKNYFYKILYKLRYFVKLTKTEIAKIKYLKKYLRFNLKLDFFFSNIKEKFFKNFIILKKKLLQANRFKKKDKLIIKLYKKYNYFKNFFFLFTHTKTPKMFLNNKFQNILKKLKKVSNQNKIKKNKANFVFKFYRSNFKIFFLKKRPFVFTIFQKNITKNPLDLVDLVKTNKDKKINYSDFGRLHTSFFSKNNFKVLKYSLSNLKKQIFSKVKIKKELYFRKKFDKSLNNNIVFFSNFLYRNVFCLYIKLFRKLEKTFLTKNIIVEEKNLKFLNNFFIFVDNVVRKDNFVLLLKTPFSYERFFSLIAKNKQKFEKNTITNDFLSFAKLVIFFYKIQNFYFDDINKKNIFYSKKNLNLFLFKYYFKTRLRTFMVKSSCYYKKTKKEDKISFTKKNKIKEIKNTKIVVNKFWKKFKVLKFENIKILNKKEKFYISLTKYKKNIKLNRINQNKNIKDIFVNKFDYFFEQAIKKNKRMIIIRMKKCQDNFIVLTVPFLFKIMQMYNFEYLVLKCNFVSSSVSAAMIARYAITRMRQGFSIGQALYGMRFGIKKSKKFAGFKFCAAGRFSRRQIATYRWIKGGSLSINTRIFGFDYAHDNFIGTFGIYGFKVWLLKAKRKINYTYG